MSVFKRKGMLFCALAALVGEGSALLALLALCAWLTGLEWLPEEYVNGYIMLCVFLSAFAVCTTISGGRGRGHLPFCLLCAAELVVLLLLLAPVANNAEPYGAWTLRVFAASAAGALAGAFLQIRHNAARKHRRKRV